MRIVTRPDFDGIVCAVLLRRAEKIDTDIFWTEPNEIQKGRIPVQEGDIIANLPYAEGCALWFDHHVSNTAPPGTPGAFAVAPSAAGVIYRHYREKGLLDGRYDELVAQTDIIDAARLDQDQVRRPEKYPYILLSMTVKNKDYQDRAYWNRLVDLLAALPVYDILKDPDVRVRCDQVLRDNADYEAHLMAHTRVRHGISITDFRLLDPVPDGNRFLTYCLFPESMAGVKIRYDGPNKRHVQISVGRSIFNPRLRVNIGTLLARFGGGGHAGAGGCTLDAATADRDIEQILAVLYENKEDSVPTP